MRRQEPVKHILLAIGLAAFCAMAGAAVQSLTGVPMIASAYAASDEESAAHNAFPQEDAPNVEVETQNAPAQTYREAQVVSARDEIRVSPRYLEEKRLANSNLVTAMASSSSSAYTRLIEDIQNVLESGEPNGVRLIPMLGRGGGQNFRDILFTRGVDMGVTDAEYMRYFSSKDPVLYGGVEQRVHYIAKLCNAEFHILARKEIGSLQDLKGKKVNFWKPLSITALAAERLFKILGVDVVPTFYDNSAALEKLRNGEIAAMTRMSAAPHGDYASVRPDDGFHMISLYDSAIPREKFEQLIATYVPAELSSAHYPKLIDKNERILTMAGSIVLAVYAWPEDSERYKRLAAFVNSMFNALDKLKAPARHPKWREFSVEAGVPGWTRFKPAQEWLDAHRSAAPRRLEATMSFSDFMVEYQKAAGHRVLSPKEQQSMYHSFLKWVEVRSVKKN